MKNLNIIWCVVSDVTGIWPQVSSHKDGGEQKAQMLAPLPGREVTRPEIILLSSSRMYAEYPRREKPKKHLPRCWLNDLPPAQERVRSKSD